MTIITINLFNTKIKTLTHVAENMQKITKDVISLKVTNYSFSPCSFGAGGSSGTVHKPIEPQAIDDHVFIAQYRNGRRR